MSIKREDYIDVGTKLQELSCPQVVGFALLPENFQSVNTIEEFRQTSEAATVKKLLKAAGVEVIELFNRAQRPRYIHNNAADWVAPTLFISSALWSQNSQAVSIALSVIANYLTDLFKGVDTATVKLDVVMEKTKTHKYMKISYEGNVAGITALEAVLKEVVDE